MTSLNESESIQTNIDWLNSVYGLNLMMDGCYYAGEEDEPVESHWLDLDDRFSNDNEDARRESDREDQREERGRYSPNYGL